MYNVADKRRFLGLSYYPNGSDVTKLIGLYPQSRDVYYAEDDAVSAGHTDMFADPDYVDRVLQLADWYSDAVDVVEASGFPIAERTMREHLVSFFLAAQRMGPKVEAHSG